MPPHVESVSVEMSIDSMTPDRQQKDSSRRQSLEPEIPVKKVSADKLEAMEQQRRASMQQRRTSLAEVISDWPTLQKRVVQKEVWLAASLAVSASVTPPNSNKAALWRMRIVQ